MLAEIFKAPCAECCATWDAELAATPAGSISRFERWCSHHAVAVSLRLDGAALVHWTAYWCPDPESFDAARAYLAGGEAGARAALEAEDALRKAGEPAH